MKKLIVLAVFCAVMSSCVKPDQIRVVGFEQISFDSPTKPNIVLRVDNASGKKIQLRDGKFRVTSGGGEVFQMMQNEDVVINRRSEQSIALPLRVKISDPFAIAAVAGKRNPDLSIFNVTGSITVKAGALRKKFEVQDMPLSQFLTIFGADTTRLNTKFF